MADLEHALLERARQHDPDAFASLQASLEPDVRRFVRRLTGGTYEEDDIIQIVFLTLYSQLHKIAPAEKLRPFVFRVARHRCYDLLRAQGRWNPVSIDEDAIELAVSFRQSDAQVSPEDATHWLLLALEVREAIERLPELQRQVLILFAEEEMSYAEIAAVMNTSIGTIKSRLHHAKLTLRRMVRPEVLRAIDGT
jgi:RNA polymerase sigma-70 factor (ECF subfamily)